MYRIVGIGELLWDLLPTGAMIGGAPANFSYHAGALGADAHVISRVGTDALGDTLLAELGTRGVNTTGIQRDSQRSTGTVAVTLADDGQPTYEIMSDVAWDHLQVVPEALSIVTAADAICFGTLAQRGPVSHHTIRTLVSASASDALRILDVNLRQSYYSRETLDASLMLANVLKVNDEELPILASMFALSGDLRAQMAQLAERWQLRAIAVTRGGRGSVLRTGHELSEHPGLAVNVMDTIGAGDAFTAAMSIGLLAGWSLDDVNARANAVAAFVAGSVGGMPVLPASIRNQFAGNTARS